MTPAPAPDEVRFLAPRSLMVRWDCSKSSVYRALSEMERLGIYAGIFIGKDRRVALSAVEAYERCLARRTTLAGSASPASCSSAPRGGAVLPLPKRPAASGDSAGTYRAVVDAIYGKRSSRRSAPRRVSARAASSGQGGRP